jgi:uncharacterized lipoprotein YddW (UPF0748 family)
MRLITRQFWAACLVAGLCAACPTPVQADAEYRAVWADAFHTGFKSTSQINSLVSRLVQGRYNMVFPEVLAYHDTGASGHGAYWNSSIVPKASDISGGIDPLAYLVQQAHANGIEVHAWLIPYRVGTSWPQPGDGTLPAHPEWTMTIEDNMGSFSKINGVYKLDPGSPDVQDYLVSIVQELVANYDIDGIHWDYIRFERSEQDEGYPSDLGYAKSGLERFRNITGYVGTPPAIGESLWDDFRRREITELVRRCRFEVPVLDPSAIQSAALITWGDAPGNFHDSSAYSSRFQDWEHWLDVGYLDLGCPMCYDDEREYPTWYRNWVDAAQVWKHERFICIGQANYLNSKANSVTQMLYARNAGAEGMINYSYYATADEDDDGWENDWTWYPYVATNLYTTTAQVPDMPWRDPADATKGTIFGRVTMHAAADEPVDDAEVTVSEVGTVNGDGNGYYIVTMVPPGLVDVSVDSGDSCIGTKTIEDVTVVAGDMVEVNFDLRLGDTNDDGVIDETDLVGVRTHLSSNPGFYRQYDVNCSNWIDLVDLLVVRNNLNE